MSEFTSEGKNEIPNLIAERQMFEMHSKLPTGAILAKIGQYAALLSSDLMPRALASIEEIQRHLIFERDYRCGDFEKVEVAL